jgi:hypothetical protein
MKSKIEDGGSRIVIFYPPYSILNGNKLFISSLSLSSSVVPVDCFKRAKLTWTVALTLIKNFSDRK